MKKTIPIMIILLFWGMQSFSQVKPFRFGFKVAPNISWISPDSKGYSADGAQLGFSWGFLADITLTENYFVKTGFEVDYLGGKLNYPHTMLIPGDTLSSVGNMNRKYNLRYLTIPLTIKMRTNQFGKVAYYGEIGFGTSFNLRAKGADSFDYNGGQSNYSSEEDLNDEVTFVKSSIIVGGGMEYFIDNSTSIILGISFSNGLNNILKGDNSVDPEIKQKGHLYYFQLTVGVMF
ncbi:MAG: PorT family protein [Chlorobi bacterium]|nr:PorT family protein [Chlorobiota bacterium]